MQDSNISTIREENITDRPDILAARRTYELIFQYANSVPKISDDLYTSKVRDETQQTLDQNFDPESGDLELRARGFVFLKSVKVRTPEQVRSLIGILDNQFGALDDDGDCIIGYLSEQEPDKNYQLRVAPMKPFAGVEFDVYIRFRK